VNVGQLLATKYDGDKAYIVHIERVDPLDVIDLSDPAKPVRLSSLEIPGWLDNLEIQGDRVIGIGYDSGHVAVALYDVSDGANTFELDRVFLGEDASWSSTNHWDSRTFKLLGDQNLLLVPFSVYAQNRSYQAVQLVDLDFDAGRLRTRGRVDQAGMAVRSFELDSRIGSFTDRRFTTANIDNRDKPYITGDVELARNIIGYTKVRGAGIQLVAEWEQPAELRAVPLTNPDAEVFDAYSRFRLERADHVYSTGSHAIVARRDWNGATGMPVVTLQSIDYRNPWKPVLAGEIEIEMLDPVYGYESGAAEQREVLQIAPTEFLVVHRGKDAYHARLISFANPNRPVFVAKTEVPVLGELMEARVVGSALYLTGFDPMVEESSQEDMATAPEGESALTKMLPPWWRTVPQKGRYYVTRVAIFSRTLEVSHPVNVPGLFIDVDVWGRLIVLDSRLVEGEDNAIDKALSSLTIRFSPVTSARWTSTGSAVLRDLLDIDDSANTALVRGDRAYYTTTQNQGGYPGGWMPWSMGNDWTLHAVDIFGTRLMETGEILLQKNGSGAILDIQTVGWYTYAFVDLSGRGVAVFDVTDAWAMDFYQYIPTQYCHGEVLIDPRTSFGHGDATFWCGMSGIKNIPLQRF
jgi:hypothetical protein